MKRINELNSLIDTIEYCQSELKFNRLIEDLYFQISLFEAEKRKEYKTKKRLEVEKKQTAGLHLDN